jgi:Glycosyl transferase family 2
VSAPGVTVVLATYNWAPVLPHAIGSVLDQTREDFELLVVGDACTDESEAVVGAVPDPRVRWINLPERARHQSGPNQAALEVARGEVVAYLGHDDLWLPQHLELVAGAVDAGAAWAHGDVLFVPPGGEPYVIPGPTWRYEPGLGIPPTSLAHRRDVALVAGGWRRPEATGEVMPDTALWAAIHDRTGPPAWVHHLTSVKIPSASREGVYRTRPHHEQEAWLGQIRASTDPEAALLACAGPIPRSTALIRLKRRVHLLLHGPPPTLAADRLERGRRFKGVQD